MEIRSGLTESTRLLPSSIEARSRCPVGKDSRELDARYPKLFVLMIEDYDAKPDVCEDLARLGKGKLYKVADFTEIPKILFDALRSLSQKRHN